MGSIIPGLGSFTGQQPASNAQSAVRQYDPSQNWSGFNQGQGKGTADIAALLTAQDLNQSWASSPGDVPPGNMFGGGGGGMSDGGASGGGMNDGGFA